MSNFTPTAEQTAVVTAAKTGENLVITAGAGSGKTSTLRLIADALAPKRGIYIAYNKAIATDAAASFPGNVECRTAHSFAYRAVGKNYAQRLKGQRLTARDSSRIMDIDRVWDLGDGRQLAPTRLASLVTQTIDKFCHSADPRVTLRHASAVVYDVPGAEEVSHDLAAWLVQRAQHAWDTDLSKTSGRLRFTHDMYVKLWALSNPTIPADFILYDEAQDADPCIAGVVLAQRHAQLIAVGDESQAIYGWRGATDAMKAWPARLRFMLTQSFRFGQAVADEANVFLGLLDAPLRITGSGPESVVGPFEADRYAVLCRTNATVISEALALTGTGRRFHIVGDTNVIRKFAEAAESLMAGRRATWHADLGAFKNWGDVLDYVANDDGGSDLRSMVNLVDDYGVAAIYQVCDASTGDEKAAHVILSTAHKSKGREWDNVRIAADFAPSEDAEEREGLSRSEAMLMYVAVTRAKRLLDATALQWARLLDIQEGGR